MTEKKPARAKKSPGPKPKLTDADRHKRFVDMAHEVQADESQKAFDQAFGRVISAKITISEPKNDSNKM